MTRNFRLQHEQRVNSRRNFFRVKSHLPPACDISWMVNVMTQHDIWKQHSKHTTSLKGIEASSQIFLTSFSLALFSFLHFSTSLMPNLVLIILMHFYIISIMIKDVESTQQHIFSLYNFALHLQTSLVTFWHFSSDVCSFLFYKVVTFRYYID